MNFKIVFSKISKETYFLWGGVILSQALGIWRGCEKYQSHDVNQLGAAFDSYAATVAIVGGIFAIIGRQLAIISRNKALKKADDHSDFLTETREVTLKAIKDFTTGGDSFPVVTTHIQDNMLNLGLRHVGDTPLVDVTMKTLCVIIEHKRNSAYKLELNTVKDNALFLIENGASIRDMPLRLDPSEKSGTLTKSISLTKDYFYLQSTILAKNGKFFQSTWYLQKKLFTKIIRTQGDSHESSQVIFECGHKSFPWGANNCVPKKASILKEFNNLGRGIVSKYFHEEVENSFGLFMGGDFPEG